MKIPKWMLGTLLLAAGFMQSVPASAVTIGQTDNFQNGTTQNWVVGLLGAVPPVPPANVPTGGPAGEGDHYLLLTSIAAAGLNPGNRMVVINLTQWTGNFLSSKVNFITMDVKNLGATDLQLRIRVEDPDASPSNTPTHIAVSTDAFFVPSAGGWTRVVFPMSPSHFTALKGDAGAALSNVAELRIFHSPTPTFPGPIIDALLGVDNITARKTLVPSTGISADFDGDGKTDIAVWRSSDGNWWIINSLTGAITVRQWGVPTDIAVPGDYDGDGKTDIAVWRPSDGNWWIIDSQTGTITVRQWGAPTDMPVPGDYDGDGKTDIAVWRPADGNWWILRSSDGAVSVTQWGSGLVNDIPVSSNMGIR